MGEEEDRDTEKTLNTVPGYNIPLNMLTNIFSMSSATYFEKRLKSIRQYLSPQDAKSQFDSFCDILRHTTGVATSPFCCNVKNCDNIYRLISLIDSESLVTSQQAIIVLTNLVGQSGAQSSISPNQIVSEPETIDTKQTISPEYFKSTDIIIAQYKTFTRPKTIRRIPKPSFSVRGAFASRLNSSANSYINAGCMLGVSDEASYSIRVLSLSETWRTTILHSPFLANIKKAITRFATDFTTNTIFQQHISVFLSDLYRDFSIFSIEYLTNFLDDLDSIFDHLAAFIYHTDDICLECTCITLSLFSYYGVRACQKILDKINIEKFLSLLRHPSEKILWPVLIVCANILSGNVCQSQLLLDFNLIASLLSLLETAKNDNIRYCIFLVATRICLGSDNQRQRLIDAGMFALARDDFETAHVQIKVQIALLFISALTCCTNNCPMIRQQSDQIFTLHLFDTFCEMLKLCDVALFQNNIRRTDKFLTALVCIIRKAEAEQFQENPPKEVPLSLHGYICKERNNLIPFISLMRMKTPFQIDSVPESQTIQNIVDFLYTTEETTKNSGSVSSTTTKKEERYIRRVTQP